MCSGGEGRVRVMVPDSMERWDLLWVGCRILCGVGAVVWW
jgi:hypothetical protein